MNDVYLRQLDKDCNLIERTYIGEFGDNATVSVVLDKLLPDCIFAEVEIVIKDMESE